MLELLYAAGAAFGICVLAGPVLIPVLHKLKYGQSIREEGPQRHQQKAGTPTMGGLMILLALTAAALWFAGNSPPVWLALFMTLGHGMLGFLDDFIKVVMKRNLGLKARQKLLGQSILTAALAYFAVAYMQRGTDLWLPLLNSYLDVGWFYYPLIFFGVIFLSNAVNLTDGLDGLASGIMVAAGVAYTIVAVKFGYYELAVFAMAVTGACLGFLVFNVYPAKVFMGDTGSLALGGALAALGVLTRTEILLVIIGGVFVIEGLSVVIQVISFKTTGKRVFLMSPLHHHFELLGWTERKVVAAFWAAGVLCGAFGLWLIM
ncbi:MAG TPA: phospho-N-acetylmuramoyl-pentapeptide-transferase [Firmicutes bacterium]|nr:phospho-N-acetylmuramoyl-pentapeptide-transferase [Bacillota bacterium]